MDLYENIITPDAEKDLVELRNYITDVLLARDTARSYVRAIRKEIAALNKMPTRYKPVDDEPWHSKGVRKRNRMRAWKKSCGGSRIISIPEWPVRARPIM